MAMATWRVVLIVLAAGSIGIAIGMYASGHLSSSICDSGSFRVPSPSRDAAGPGARNVVWLKRIDSVRSHLILLYGDGEILLSLRVPGGLTRDYLGTYEASHWCSVVTARFSRVRETQYRRGEPDTETIGNLDTPLLITLRHVRPGVYRLTGMLDVATGDSSSEWRYVGMDRPESE